LKGRVFVSGNKQAGAKTAVIVLNWNSRGMTAECIRSLLRMRAGDFQVIVVDNGSHDGSVNYLRQEFPQVTVLPQDHNLGFAAGCNVGMRHALKQNARFVLLVNNDTVVEPNFLRELECVAEQHPQAAMVSPKIYFWDAPERLWWAGGEFSLRTGIPKHIGRKALDAGQFDRVVELDWATGCAILIRCDAVAQVGLFDERFFGNVEDVDLSLRMRKAGFAIWYAPNAKLWHKEGVDYKKNGGEYLRKFTGTRNLLFAMRKHAGPLQWLTFLPNFLVRHVIAVVVQSMRHGDFRSAWAVFQGIGAFLRMCANPDSSTLPPEIMARPKDVGLDGGLTAEKEPADANRN
jgi:GT2 family glycosyltransferase